MLTATLIIENKLASSFSFSKEQGFYRVIGFLAPNKDWKKIGFAIRRIDEFEILLAEKDYLLPKL